MNKAYELKMDTLVKVPQRPIVTGSAELNAPARDVWRVVGNFAGFPVFIPIMAHIEMTGTGVRSIRRKLFKDGNIVIEQLNTYDDEAMRMTWSTLWSTFDIGNLWAAMRVDALTANSCIAHWDIAAEPWQKGPEAQANLDQLVRVLLDMATSNWRTMFNK